MVERFSNYNGTTCTGHYHDGNTCHGSETLEACAEEAVRNEWTGRILEKTDTHRDKIVKCYSLIAHGFEHWSQYGTFVAVIELHVRKL